MSLSAFGCLCIEALDNGLIENSKKSLNQQISYSDRIFFYKNM